jgi:hypothetical protein
MDFQKPKPVVLKCEELGPKLDQRFYQNFKKFLNQNWRFFQIKNLIKEIWIGVTVVLFEN